MLLIFQILLALKHICFQQVTLKQLFVKLYVHVFLRYYIHVVMRRIIVPTYGNITAN